MQGGVIQNSNVNLNRAGLRARQGRSASTYRDVGIYLWENRVAANAAPQHQEGETPMVVESAERRLVAAE
jgi:hypothetical protein